MGEIKIALFADDTQCYISDLKAVDIWFQHLHTYELASGAVVNINKSFGILIGLLKGQEHVCNKIKWTDGPILALGVNHGIKLEQVLFWENMVNKFKNILSVWKKRNLTLFGKSYVVKSLGVSTLLFAFKVLNVPENVLKAVNKIIWDFIWDGKPDKVKREVCTRQTIFGGLGVPNVKNILCAQRLLFLGNVFSGGNEHWKLLPRYFLKVYNNNRTGILQLDTPIDEYCIPPFYKTCLKMWKNVQGEKFPSVVINTITNYFQPILQERQHLNFPEDAQINFENSLYLKDTNGTWVDLNTCKQKEAVNLIDETLIKSKNEEFWENTYYDDIEWSLVYRTETYILLSQRVKEFHWKCINNCVMTEKRLIKMNISDGLCKLCECDTEDLIHVLCDCDSIVGFWKFVINIIITNISSYKYLESEVILGCMNGNLCMREKQIVNFFILNAKWIVWKRRCRIIFENDWINEKNMLYWFVNDLKYQQQLLMSSKNTSVRYLAEKLILNFNVNETVDK